MFPIFFSSFLFWYVFRVLILLCLPLPAPFTLLSQSAPPPPFLSSLSSLTQPFLCFSPHGSPFPASYPFNHPLSSYPPPAFSVHTCRPAFFHTHNLLYLYPASAIFSQSNHAEMQCNCANVSYPSLSLSLAHSTLEQACLSVWAVKDYSTIKTSEVIHKWGVSLQVQNSSHTWSSSTYSDTLWDVA